MFDHQGETPDVPFTRDFVMIYGRPGPTGYVFDFWELLENRHKQIVLPWEDHEELELGDRIRYYVHVVTYAMVKHTPTKDFAITYEDCDPFRPSILSFTKQSLLEAKAGSFLDLTFNDKSEDEIELELVEVDLSELVGYEIIELGDEDDFLPDAYDITEDLEDVEAERP